MAQRLRKAVLRVVVVVVLFAMASAAADPSKMKLKELRKLLQDRGVKCIGYDFPQGVSPLHCPGGIPHTGKNAR